MAKEAARLAEEHIVEVDDEGRLRVKHDDDPVLVGANLIGPIDAAVILYVAKNTSERSAFLIKRNRNAIKFIMNGAKETWKSFLECDASKLTKLKDTDPAGCKKCRFKELCK
jgi:hypothetical protein